MKYATRLILLPATLLLVAGCASSNVLTAPAEGCSVLAAPVLERVTPHAVLGNTGDAALDWQLYGTAETVQLNSANRDKADGLKVLRLCEERDQRSYRKINAPWWAFWS